MSFGSKLIERLAALVPEEKRQEIQKTADDSYSDDGKFLFVLKSHLKPVVNDDKLEETVDAVFREHLEAQWETEKASVLKNLVSLSARMKDEALPEDTTTEVTPTIVGLLSLKWEMCEGRPPLEIVEELLSVSQRLLTSTGTCSDELKELAKQLMESVSAMKERYSTDVDQEAIESPSLEETPAQVEEHNVSTQIDQVTINNP